MCKGLLGRKIGMAGIFSPMGESIPVTVLEVGPCIVTQVKTVARDGYDALQVGFGTRRKSRINQPLAGHLEKSGGHSCAILREFSVDNLEDFTVGQTITVEIFEAGERVDVTGSTKGRGFAGVVKRHGFHGGRETHGSKSHRSPGSIGCSATPAKVIKGKSMPGQYGNSRQTVRNLEVVDIRPDQNLLLVKGAVPGARSGIVEVRKPKFAG